MFVIFLRGIVDQELVVVVEDDRPRRADHSYNRPSGSVGDHRF